MMLDAGKLRHRLIFQKLLPVLDSAGQVEQDSMGEIEESWQEQFKVWGAVEAVSARDFAAAQADQSKVANRITIRRRADLDSTMRILQPARGLIFDIVGILPDKESGLEYVTIAASEGVRYGG